MFLQDPQDCDRNVRYRNPHRLSDMDRDAPMTIDRDLSVKEVRQQGWGSSNYLDDLDFRENFPLADIPHALNIQLFKHQRQALYFMLERERGWSFTGELSDIWKFSHISGLRMYMNTVSDEVQMEPPIIFRGGLLADQVSIISLVASDLDLQQISSTPLQSSLVKPLSHCLQCVVRR
jgi:SWI/SNF-related matrix-associated actin-dependent regulator of chromatin subfamily A3